MHGSKGGVTLGAILDMEMDEFGEWMDAAEEFHKRLAAATK